MHLINRYFDLLSVPLHNRRLRSHLHQIFQSICRSSLGERLQCLSHSDQCRYHRRGLKIQLVMIQRHQVHVRCTSCQQICHTEQDKQGPAEGYTGPQSHQCIHIGRAVKKRLEAGDKKCPVDDHHHDRKQHLKNRKTDVVMYQKFRYRPVPHIVPHCDIHQRDQKSDRQNQPPDKLRRLAVLQCVLLCRKLCGRTLLLSGSILRLGTVSGILHRFYDFSRSGCTVNSHRIGQKRNRYRFHSRNL